MPSSNETGWIAANRFKRNRETNATLIATMKSSRADPEQPGDVEPTETPAAGLPGNGRSG
jgi:hypothetical protein